MSLREIYRLRAFEPGSLEDIERVNLMYYHPEVMKAKGYYRKGEVVKRKADLQKAEAGMLRVSHRLTRRQRDIMYAVVDVKSKVVGWIWLYFNRSHPLPTRVRKEFGLSARKSRFYEVSYQKLLSKGWPNKLLSKVEYITPTELNAERKGVIVEGLRLAMGRIRREFRKIFGREKTLVLYAYVLPDNLASSKVLEKNGFTRYARQYRVDKEWTNLWIKLI